MGYNAYSDAVVTVCVLGNVGVERPRGSVRWPSCDYRLWSRLVECFCVTFDIQSYYYRFLLINNVELYVSRLVVLVHNHHVTCERSGFRVCASLPQAIKIPSGIGGDAVVTGALVVNYHPCTGRNNKLSSHVAQLNYGIHQPIVYRLHGTDTSFIYLQTSDPNALNAAVRSSHLVFSDDSPK